MDIHNPVFFVSASFIVLFVIVTIQFPAQTNAVLGTARGWSLATFDSFMMTAGSAILAFCLALPVLPVWASV